MASTKQTAGRPKLTEGKRTKKIDARFTEAEYQIIEDLEHALGVRKTDLVRTRLLQDSPAILFNAKELITLVDRIGTELGRAGNNINQLARYANIQQKKEILSPVVVSRFNFLFENYIENQKELEIALRKVLRAVGR